MQSKAIDYFCGTMYLGAKASTRVSSEGYFQSSLRDSSLASS